MLARPLGHIARLVPLAHLGRHHDDAEGDGDGNAGGVGVGGEGKDGGGLRSVKSERLLCECGLDLRHKIIF